VLDRSNGVGRDALLDGSTSPVPLAGNAAHCFLARVPRQDHEQR
jgi:hypothetical protein